MINNTNPGWIKLNRSIADHWLWQNPLKLKWWLDLLMMAAYKPQKRLVGAATLVTLQRGQLIASVRFLQQRWHYSLDPDDPRCGTVAPSPKRIVRFLRLLEQEGLISRTTIAGTKGDTVISIVNYDDYQQLAADVEPATTQQTTHQTEPQIDTQRSAHAETHGETN